MKKPFRVLALVFVLAMLMSAVAGCKTAADKGPGGTGKNDTLVVTSAEAFSGGWDPGSHTVLANCHLQWVVLGNLVELDYDTGEYKPSLATEWKYMDDGYSMEFKLRQGVTFHDGSTFDAEDVKATVADEPISALDVSLQAQVLNLLMALKEEFNLSMLFVAHDLAVVRQMADYTLIMYAGQIMEAAPAHEIYDNALHPYTKVLLKSAPSIKKGIMGKDFAWDLKVGDVPDPANPPSGCLFHTRCVAADETCSCERPALREVSPGHFVRCSKL